MLNSQLFLLTPAFANKCEWPLWRSLFLATLGYSRYVVSHLYHWDNGNHSESIQTISKFKSVWTSTCSFLSTPIWHTLLNLSSSRSIVQYRRVHANLPYCMWMKKRDLPLHRNDSILFNKIVAKQSFKTKSTQIVELNKILCTLFDWKMLHALHLKDRAWSLIWWVYGP